MIKQAMVMAAGLGTRMKPFTALAPKPMLPVLGVPLLELVLEQLVDAGVEHAVINVHHMADQITAFLKSWESKGRPLRITVSDERKLLLGSAGGVAKALPHFRGRPFFLLNADVLQGFDLTALAAAHATRRTQLDAVMTLATLQSEGPASYRELKCEPNSDRVISAGNVKPGVRYFASAAVIEPEAYLHINPSRPSEFFPDVLSPWIDEGKVAAWQASGFWFDIGEPKLWAQAHFSLMERLEKNPESLAPYLVKCLEPRIKQLAPGVWAEAFSMPIAGALEGKAPLFIGSKTSDTRGASRSVLYSNPSQEHASGVISWGPHETVCV
jgi:NDP-sugar pyrophosphorylase family protein